MGIMLAVMEGLVLALWFLFCWDRVEIRRETDGLMRKWMEKDYAFLCGKTRRRSAEECMLYRIFGSFIAWLGVTALLKSQFSAFSLATALCAAAGAYKLDYYRMKVMYTRLLAVARREFPFYLNHLTILIQNTPVVNAIEKSIRQAPGIFQEELRELVVQVHRDGADLKPCLLFAQRFRQVDVFCRIMRSLYSLSITAENREMILMSFSRMTNEKIQTARKLRLQGRIERQNMIPYLLFLWLGFVILNMIASIRFF